jgi:hypothetical protein
MLLSFSIEWEVEEDMAKKKESVNDKKRRNLEFY